MAYNFSHAVNTNLLYNIYSTSESRRPNVFDIGTTLYKCYANVLCSMYSMVLTTTISCIFCNNTSHDSRELITPQAVTTTSQQTRHVRPMLGLCWPSVVDGWPTLAQHWVRRRSNIKTTLDQRLASAGQNLIPYARPCRNHGDGPRHAKRTKIVSLLCTTRPTMFMYVLFLYHKCMYTS